MKILCIDIEGGYGGSSRSLYEFVRVVKDLGAEIEVWYRKEGQLGTKYRTLGIPTRHEPSIPNVSALLRLSRNLFVFGQVAANWKHSLSVRQRLLDRIGDFDLVHLNHEGLFLLARWLKPRIQIPITCHVRSILPNNFFSRLQFRILTQYTQALVFITENEMEMVENLLNRKVRGKVINNIARSHASIQPGYPEIAADSRFKVCILSNYSYMRGIDRLIEVASMLKNMSVTNVVFIIAGNMNLTGSLPGKLGEIARKKGTLADLVALEGLSDMFHFLGHVDDPESLLSVCDVLAKPTREFNPWGRDILEALAAGKPVFSVGSYERFVENGETGVIDQNFNAQIWAKKLVDLSHDSDECSRIGRNAAERIRRLCEPKARADDLMEFWHNAISHHVER